MKKNIPLIVGIAIPFIMIALVAGSVYLPKLFVKPTYSFVFSDQNRNYYPYQYGIRYEVDFNGKIKKVSVPIPKDYVRENDQIVEPKLYMYDPVKDSSSPITFEEALKYKLDPSSSSPDGFALERTYSNLGLFGEIIGGSRGDRQKWSLVKGSASHKINIRTTSSNSYDYYYDNISFIGWISK